MPKVYPWSDYKNELYQRYIIQDQQLAEVVDTMFRDYGLQATYV